MAMFNAVQQKCGESLSEMQAQARVQKGSHT
jgi:hypothetical protein